MLSSVDGTVAAESRAGHLAAAFMDFNASLIVGPRPFRCFKCSSPALLEREPYLLRDAEAPGPRLVRRAIGIVDRVNGNSGFPSFSDEHTVCLR